MLLVIGFIYFLSTGLLVTVAIAFVTLLERKLLGIIQFRRGPNKSSLQGVFQPFSDALKLLSKSRVNLIYSSGVKYMIMPLGMFVIMLLLWGVIPSDSKVNSYLNSGLIIISLLSLEVFPVIWGSWFSLSFYSMIGSMRCVAQMISYEVSMVIILMSFFMLIGEFMVSDFKFFYSLFFIVPLSILFFFSCLMELNRSPSDLIEGESELVSGFNTEFYGLNFSLIFLGEYGFILFMSGLLVLMLVGVSVFSFLGVLLELFVVNLIILIRGALPRIRYDFLMYLCWTSCISLSLGCLVLIIGFCSILW